MQEITKEYLEAKGFVQHGTIFIKRSMVVYKSGSKWYFACKSDNRQVNKTELGQLIYNYENHEKTLE